MQTRISNLTDDQTQMVRGIAQILLGVKDLDNRMKLAKDQIQKFKDESIVFNYAGFLSMAGLDNSGEDVYMDIRTQPTHRVHKESTKLRDMMGELYSNPICPRKQNESDEAYKLRCAPLMGPSVLMNLPSVNQTPMGEAMIRSVKEMIRLINLLKESQRVNCKGCGWSWDYSDGGKQPYLCHKCGTDNTPIEERGISGLEKRIKKIAKAAELKKENERIPRKKGQHTQSSSHSDLYTDENPVGTIKGLKFATVKDAEDSVAKIKSSGKSHAHKIQAAVAMEQRARVMGKTTAAGVYRTYINSIKKS